LCTSSEYRRHIMVTISSRRGASTAAVASQLGGVGGGGGGRKTLCVALLSFVVGVSTGLAVGLYIVSIESSSVTSSTSSSSSYSSKALRPVKKSGTTADDSDVWATPVLPVMKSVNSHGWHPVYVYHGGVTTTSSDKDEKAVIDKLPLESVAFEQNHDQYGSQVDQDKVIMGLINQYRKNQPQLTAMTEFFFIDLAANDAIQLSNTLNLEKSPHQNWKGLCIEPNPIYWYRLAHRSCTVAGAFVGGAADNQSVQVSLGNEVFGGIISSDMDNTPGHATRKKHRAGDSTKKMINEERFVVSLSTLFQQFSVPSTIDYLNLDVEGAEYMVMENFPFDDYTFRTLTVERPKPNLKELLQKNNYIFVMLLVNWGETLWIHGSFLKESGMTIKELQALIRKTSSHTQTATEKGSRVYSVDTGDYYTFQG
jgi:hypothetical protein